MARGEVHQSEGPPKFQARGNPQAGQKRACRFVRKIPAPGDELLLARRTRRARRFLDSCEAESTLDSGSRGPDMSRPTASKYIFASLPKTPCPPCEPFFRSWTVCLVLVFLVAGKHIFD